MNDFTVVTKPIDMVLHCPVCHLQHIDAKEGQIRGGDVCIDWDNPPHKSHLCHGCGCIWRPCDLPTNGVASITTRGKADTWPIVDNNTEMRAEHGAGWWIR